MANKLSYTTQRWTDQFEQIDIEIGQLASVCQVRLLDDPAKQTMVEIVPTQRGIATRGQYFEHALGELQNRDIKSAAAQVINGVNTL